MSIKFKLHCFVFLGACLLFTMEPLVARMVLPLYGGSFHVWSTTLTFFQGILFIGYVYCHIFAKRLGGWHLALVATPLVWLPLANSIGLAPPGDGDPAWSLLFQLTLHIALPFGILATTSVIAQSWFTRSDTSGSSPYPLYASSNAGSLLALLAYIALFEPLFGLRVQRSLWYVGYLVYVVLAWRCWRMAASNPKKVDPAIRPSSDIKGSTLVNWLLLSAIPSAFMLAVSNVITLELGSVPLVWILPLVLYLLSYVFTFGQRQWISPTLLHAFWPAAVVCGLSSLYFVEVGNLWVFAAHLVALFALSMVGHGELHRLRPPPNQLTVFYLAIAFGGWMGSMAVSLIAPILFNNLAEYPIVVGVFALTILYLRKGDLLEALRRHPGLSSLGASIALALPFLIRSNDLGAVTEVIYQHRNYYGIYRVFSQPLSQDKFPNLSEEERYDFGQRQLVHGSTIHGSQVLHPVSRRSPTSYYHRAGPLWDVLGDAKKARNVAVIGLGVGTCATYFQEGESLTFYELDPAIVNIAQNLFTYLVDCPAEVKMVVGDARLQLEQAPDHSYDIILVDAFSSDAIPTHLLTREALSLYDKKLAPQGTLVFHTSSRYYDLLGVIKSTSANSWKALCKWTTNENLRAFQSSSSYCVLRRKDDDVSALLTAGWFSMENYRQECAPWSDDYINTLRPLYLMLRPQSWQNDR
ncbi:MAG: fused MFS/spermidine synthase [Verrucomicrobiota bacterium]|jgi:hypothetical protein|nr:fused MFS/spermidine synthase [Verrucomicrobiota bacterium]MDP7052022.1 fused MFS/spermidine synthase [Verrucomicrobiota bacterium]